MSVYDLHIKRLALLLLPTHYRRPLIAAFAQSFTEGVARVHGCFMSWREKTDRRLEYNGQVCRLRGALNDLFDPKERRITISDGNVRGSQEGSLRVFVRTEERHELVPQRNSDGAMILNRRGFSGISGYDFFVSIPAQLRGEIDEIRLRATVNTYKLVSKRWAINYN